MRYFSYQVDLPELAELENDHINNGYLSAQISQEALEELAGPIGDNDPYMLLIRHKGQIDKYTRIKAEQDTSSAVTTITLEKYDLVG